MLAGLVVPFDAGDGAEGSPGEKHLAGWFRE